MNTFAENKLVSHWSQTNAFVSLMKTASEEIKLISHYHVRCRDFDSIRRRAPVTHDQTLTTHTHSPVTLSTRDQTVKWLIERCTVTINWLYVRLSNFPLPFLPVAGCPIFRCPFFLVVAQISVALFNGCPFFRGPNFRCPFYSESNRNSLVYSSRWNVWGWSRWMNSRW